MSNAWNTYYVLHHVLHRYSLEVRLIQECTQRHKQNIQSLLIQIYRNKEWDNQARQID